MTAARKNIMLGTAGHVDHGKTALVKLLTGCDTDRLVEEKRRGLTIELGFAPCVMGDERIVGIVDVPGHVDFIRNMVAGAHGLDVVILVVAADDGVMPQTREHLDILTLMGIRHGLVAMTKIDLVDPDMRDLAMEDIRQFMAGTFLEDAEICPISNITGKGFDAFFAALNGQVSACDSRENSGLFRLWIERVFTVRGFGTVLSGVATSGQVRVGDRLDVLPGDRIGRVRALQVYGRDAEIGHAGECVALNLADIDTTELSRGTVLVEGDCFETASMFEAELLVLPTVSQPMKDYAEVHLHVGTAEAVAHVAILNGTEIAPGETRLVQLRLNEPVGVVAGERFVIRAAVAGSAGGRVTTIGGGRILGASNIRLRRNRPWTLEALEARRDALDRDAAQPGATTAWCAVQLKEAQAPLTVRDLARRAQRPAEAVENAVEQLRARGVVNSRPAAAR